MKLIEILTPDFCFNDERGRLTQLCSGGYNQINAVFTKKGAVRGRMHYHKENTEVFFIIDGEVTVTVSYAGLCETHKFSTGDMFSVPPFVRHDFAYTKDTCLVGMYSGCVEKPDGTKDIYSDEE